MADACPHPPQDQRSARTGWRVFYGDVSVGTIARRSGCPVNVDQWEWSCGFYPGDRSSGTAATLDEAWAAFEAAWTAFLPTRTEADFQAWRDQRDRTAQNSIANE